MIWTMFLLLEQIAPSWRHIFALLHARVVGSRVYAVTLHDQKWWELRDSLADFSQWWQGISQGRRTRALLCAFMLRVNGKGEFFRVEFPKQCLRGEKLNYNSCTSLLLRKSQNLLFLAPEVLWALKVYRVCSIHVFFKCFEPCPYLVCHVTTIENV